MHRLLIWSGIAVLVGGVLTFLINVSLTPFINYNAPFPETAASSLFLLRQCLSAIAALLLLFGSVGLHLHQSKSSKRFGWIAFLLAFLGSTFVLAQEWNQVFFVHELALLDPDTLMKVDSTKGLSLFDIGSMIALFTFAIGWIMFSISMLKAKVYSRRGPILVISGFFAIPILSAILPMVWGAVIGTAILGYGLFLLGRELYLVNVSIRKTNKQY